MCCAEIAEWLETKVHVIGHFTQKDYNHGLEFFSIFKHRFQMKMSLDYHSLLRLFIKQQ